MKRTQLYLEESIWRGLQAMARNEQTTISELVRKAVQAQYFHPTAGRAKAMQALVGIRKTPTALEDSTTLVRNLRKGNRLSRLHPE